MKTQLLKMKFLKILSTLIILFIKVDLSGQTLITWDCTSAATQTTGSHSNLSIGSWIQGNNYGATTLVTTISASSSYSGATGTSNFGAAARVGALNTGASGSAYFEVTFTVNNPGAIRLTGFSFGTRSTTTGPQAYCLRWDGDNDNFSQDLLTGTITNNSNWQLKEHSNLNLPASAGTPSTQPQTIKFRLFGFNGTGTPSLNTANWRVDDISFTFDTPTLPVTFIQFSGTKSNKSNYLLWSTASEQNNSGFAIERSTNGTNFENIGFVKSLSSNGNSSSRLDYSFTDFNPIGLNQYYRLKQTDFDGTRKYSAIVMVRREAPTALTLTKVYPNPANSSIYINASVPTKMDLQFLIIDVAGRVVSTKNVFADVGNNGFDMTVEHLKSGTYFIKAISKEQGVVATEKFIKF